MKRLLPMFLLTPVAYADSDLYLSLGKGLRHGAYNVAAGYEPLQVGNSKFGLEIELNDAGDQPEPHKNINRMLNLSAVAHVKISERIYGLGKLGISSTRFSRNGTNDYEADKSFNGTTASVGLETPLSKDLMVGFQASVFEYQQTNNPNKGGYSNAVIHVRWKL
jgi:hypothetical protein